MSITITYPESGHSRVQRNLTQRQVNAIITGLSDWNVGDMFVPVKVIVADDVQ